MSTLTTLLLLSSSLVIIIIIILFSPNYPLLANAETSNQTDHPALLEFQKRITNDPRQILRSWNDSTHFCNWVGVSCDNQPRVTSLVLVGLDLTGTLPPHIGNLSFLKAINLEKNNFHGKIPQQVGNLLHLQEINLTWNSLNGEIPVNLTRCSNLRIIRLQSNHLQGTIPPDIGSLSKLEYVRLGTNNLTGEIPPSVGNLSELVDFGAAYLNLVGSIPDSLGRLRRLGSISLGVNQMTGTIPRSFFNLTSVTIIAIPWNQFEGSLPEDIGFTLPNIKQFAISKNKLLGTIPKSLCNATQLTQLDMNRNGFTGQIPDCLGNLPQLYWLSAGANRLGSKSIRDFDFLTSLQNCSLLELLQISDNNFGGILPDSIANLSVQLSVLDVGVNQLTGVIPAGLQNYVNLTTIDLSSNLFQGSIPSFFSRFPKLESLRCAANQLTGQILPSIGNLSQLSELDVSSNQLEGVIPLGLGSCLQLISLDLSENKLTGAIPSVVFRLPSLSKSLNLSHNLFTGNLSLEDGNLENLNALDISHNFLTGEVPSSIGGCESLEYLYLQSNSFNGTIPSSLGLLKGLRDLDLSLNKLRGEIPSELRNNTLLQHLNLSFNSLQGEVPKEGIFSNASVISLMGNSMLCGGVSDLHLQSCPTKPDKQRINSKTVALTVVFAVVGISFLSLLAIKFLVRARRSKAKPSLEDPRSRNLMRVSYNDLNKATNGFSPKNLVGSGSFGSVYKGTLEVNDDKVVAVKVLNLQKTKAYKSLAAECNTLRSVKHRNLVRVVSYCSSLDHKGEEFRALVFEYMENGSLEKWLHVVDGSHNLSLLQRLNIAIDVANALHYLHDLCETPIVHHDLKPSNILLDNDMVAHVSDFGLARFLTDSKPTTSTIGVQGTVGYAAPEYGMGSPASKEGDVYSFGILVLEMFSGKRPTNEMFKDGLNIRDYVKEALPDKLSYVINVMPLVPAGEAAESSTAHDENEISEQVSSNRRDVLPEKEVHKCLVSLLEIGVACSAESPQHRTKIADVIGKLQCIKVEVTGNRTRYVGGRKNRER